MVPLVTWHETLLIGVPEIDAHHKALAGLLNELHEAVHRRRGVDACRGIVEKLRRCALSHLDAEERLMHLSGHASYSENLEEQRDLIQRLDDMLARMDDANSNITFHGLHQLRSWLLAHIRFVGADDGAAAAVEPEAAPRVFGLLLKRT